MGFDFATAEEFQEQARQLIHRYLTDLEEACELAREVARGRPRSPKLLAHRISVRLQKLPEVLKFVRQACLGVALEHLLGACDLVILSREDVADPDGKGNPLTTYHADPRGPRAAGPVVRQDLLECLAVAGGVRMLKRCRGECGQLKTLSNFSSLRSTPDGRNHRCRACEARRVDEHTKAVKDRQRVEALHRAGIPTKVCMGPCGLEYETAFFWQNCDSPDGLRSWCKGCMAEARKGGACE